jgi:hypothetical protein
MSPRLRGKAARLALPLGAPAALAQGQEPECAGRHARGRRGLGTLKVSQFEFSSGFISAKPAIRSLVATKDHQGIGPLRSTYWIIVGHLIPPSRYGVRGFAFALGGCHPTGRRL